ncbi:hypothetical protein ACP70R_026718 [Stipagrostis hirtigluma subsp. patula]
MRGTAEPPAAAAAAAAATVVDVELLKAVAQAWYAQSGNPRPSRASSGGDDGAGTRRGVGAGAARHRPSRFKLEAMAAAAAASASAAAPPRERSWDFARSLWDTYELVTVARKLESGLVVRDHGAAPPAVSPLAYAEVGAPGAGKRGKESRRSLRSLFLRSSSSRIQESNS